MTADGTAPKAREGTDERDALLRAQDWGKLLAQLTAIALKRIRGRSMEDAEDLAQGAIAVAYRSRAAGGWDPDKGPLERFLVAQVIGTTNNERRRKRNRCEVWLDEEAEDEQISVHERHLADSKPAPDEAFDRLRLAAVFRERLVARVEGDALSMALIDAMADGLSKPIELAAAVNRPETEVRVTRRRLRYHAEEITKELSASSGPSSSDGPKKVKQ